MLTGSVKNKVDAIWDDIWAGGITNPITVIEQLTYLMFIRSLDEKDLEAETFEALSGEELPKIFASDAESQLMRWSRFKNLDAREMYDIVSQKVFPFIKGLGDENTAFSRYMRDAMFLFPEGKKQLLQKVVTGLDILYEEDIKDWDMLGDLYEYMLGKLSQAGTNGQFRTPKHIRDMMVELVSPRPSERICDPACGTAGFLVSSAEYIRRHFENVMSAEEWEMFDGEAFSGFEFDQTMLRISAMNMMLHSVTHPRIEYKDSISKQNEISGEFDVILANPPFTGSVDVSGIHESLTAVASTKKTELLFLSLFVRMLKKGGRCACIVPDGVLFGSSKAHKAVRREIVESHQLQAVISMPSGVFKPYAGVSTAVLLFMKTGAGGTDKVWFYDMRADGFSLDDKRSPVSENDIPDILLRFANLAEEESRERTEQSFFVGKSEIAENGYDLSINKYKKVIYEAVSYPPTADILAELKELEAAAAKGLEELEGMLKDD